MNKEKFVGLWKVDEIIYNKGEFPGETEEEKNKMLEWAKGKSNDDSVLNFLERYYWTGDNLPCLFLKIEDNGTIHQIDKTAGKVFPSKILTFQVYEDEDGLLTEGFREIEVEDTDALELLSPDFTFEQIGVSRNFSFEIAQHIDLSQEKLFITSWMKEEGHPWSDFLWSEGDSLVREIRVVWDWTYPCRWILKYKRTEDTECERKEESLADCVGKWQLVNALYMYKRLDFDIIENEEKDKIDEWMRGEKSFPIDFLKNLTFEISEEAEWQTPEKLHHIKLEIKNDGKIIQSISSNSPIEPDVSSRINFLGGEQPSEPLSLFLPDHEGRLCKVGKDNTSLSYEISSGAELNQSELTLFREIIREEGHCEIIEIFYKKNKQLFREIRARKNKSELYRWVLTYNKYN